MRPTFYLSRAYVFYVLPPTLFALLLCGHVNADTGCSVRQLQQHVLCQEVPDRLPPRPAPMVRLSDNLLGIALESKSDASEVNSISQKAVSRSAKGSEEDSAVQKLLFSVRIPDAADNGSSPQDLREPLFGKMLHQENSTDDDPAPPVSDKFHWGPAIYQSLIVLGVQHSYALISQEKTRRALKGPFIRDYFNSVKAISGWDDGNRFFTNYIAHPMQGGLTGFLFVQNHDRAKKQKFAESPQYWKDRLKALAWSAAWSTQFEIGPISQSSIGNVGLRGAMGYVDLVITPTVGTAWLVSEEAIDRYIIRHLEMRSDTLRVLMRIILNPMRSMGNILRFKEPWYRDRRPGH